jgi:hypothetical protein
LRLHNIPAVKGPALKLKLSPHGFQIRIFSHTYTPLIYSPEHGFIHITTLIARHTPEVNFFEDGKAWENHTLT